jgi:hypothetical protein
MPSGLALFTLVHVAISLAAIVAGFVVAYGLLVGKRMDGWTAFFLATTVLTSVTGFFFPVDHFMPSHGVGIVSLLMLGVAIYARYGRRLTGVWRPIYVVTALIAFYFNFVVLVIQSFQKIPALKALAPTQSEPPFLVTQLVVLVLFTVLIVVATIKFRNESAPDRSITDSPSRKTPRI